MTPEEKERQRRSFAYGNVHMHNPNVTRELVDRVADEMAKDARIANLEAALKFATGEGHRQARQLEQAMSDNHRLETENARLRGELEEIEIRARMAQSRDDNLADEVRAYMLCDIMRHIEQYARAALQEGSDD